MRWQDYLWLMLLTGAYILIYLFNRKRKKRSKAPRLTGRRLTRFEQSAWHKLQARGYQLNEIHPSLPVMLAVDGKKSTFTYEGNFIVTRGGESFLVKIKRGDAVPSPAGLRRELLLDYLFFQTDSILFYHEGKEQFQEMRFSFQSDKGNKEGFLLKAALFLIIIIGIAFLYRLVSGSIL